MVGSEGPELFGQKLLQDNARLPYPPDDPGGLINYGDGEISEPSIWLIIGSVFAIGVLIGLTF